MISQKPYGTFNPPDTHLVDRLRYWVRQQPDEVAFYLYDGEEDVQRLTYRQLDQQARKIASELACRSLCGERVLLLYPSGLQFVAALFGCFYAGAIVVPVVPPRRHRYMDKIRAIAEDARASAVLTVSDVLPRIQETLQEMPYLSRMAWLATDQLSPKRNNQWSLPDWSRDQVAVLQYTSGSTGSPKAVVLTHANLIHNTEIITQAFKTNHSDVGMTWLPNYHDMGLVGGVLKPVYFGLPNVLMSPMVFLQRPVRWLRGISRFAVTISGGPNFAYDLCVQKITPDQCVGLDLSRWDVAYNGAEPIRADTLRRFAKKFAPFGFRSESFHPCYGMAESTLIVTGGNKHDPPKVRALQYKNLCEHRVVDCQAGDSGTREVIGVGHVLSEGEIQIVDPRTCRQLPPDHVGEIWIRSPSVGKGYWNQPETTRRIFQARLSSNTDRSFLRTGDLGFLRDGQLFVTGRLSDLIIIRGVNYYPHDIERTVASADTRLVSDVIAAFSVDQGEEEALVVAAEIQRSRNQDWDSALATVQREIAHEHEIVASRIVLVRPGAIPRTSSGKIQRQKCRQALQEGSLPIVAQWIRPQVGKDCDEPAETGSFEPKVDLGNGHSNAGLNPDVAMIVLRHVRQVAGDRAQRLTIDSSLLELGLDSLEQTQIAVSLEQHYGGRFPDEILEHIETVRQLAMAVEQQLKTQPVVPQNRPKDYEAPVESYQFERFPEYVRLKETMGKLSGLGLVNPYFRVQEAAADAVTVVDGRHMVNFSSYDYLGLSRDPTVACAAKQAIDRYGTSVSASRLVSGERSIHGELEKALAAFLGVESALVFVGGHATNETTIGHLCGPPDLILHDELAHNSILQGSLLSGASRRSFPHNDWRALDQMLDQLRHQFRRVLIAVEGVYSMDGDVVCLPEIVRTKKKHGALLLVDEAHSIGTMGPRGRGVGEHFGIPGDEVDLWMGTFSKAFGSCGGYIAGRDALVEYLKFTAPGFVYSVGMPPASAAAALAALRVMESQPERVTRCRIRAARFLELARARGLDTGTSHGTPIVPVVVGSSQAALELSRRLFEQDINVQPILYPAVSENAARLRFFMTSLHTDQQIEAAADAVTENLKRTRTEGMLLGQHVSTS